MEEPLLNKINKRYEAAKAYRKAIGVDKNTKLNVAFFEERQWVVYDPNFNRVIDYYPPRNKPRITSNLIMPVVRIEFAKITRNDPTYTVVTTRTDRDSIAKAKICSRFLEFKWPTDDWISVFKNALLWALLGGIGFTKTIFDPKAGPTINGEPLGDIVIDYCSPLELFIDPLARSLDEASWVIHERVRSIEYVKAKYGEKVSPDSGESNSALGIYGKQRALPEGTFPTVSVKEYWERPNYLNPDGRYTVAAGNKILWDGVNPYVEECPIPFESMVHIPVPGQLYGNSVVTYLRSINVAYNKLKSDIMENTTKLSNPPIIAPLNAFEKPPELTPGEIIYYNPMVPGKIDQLQFEPYPPQVMNTMMRILQERDDISGVNETTRGQVPRGVRSGDALMALAEQDETRLAVAARNYEALIEKTLTKVLRLARKFYDVPRVIRFAGTENEYDTYLFKSEDIPPDADVHVEAGSTLPKSEIQTQNYLMQLWDRGILTDPRLLVRLTHYGNPDEVLADLELDMGQAQRENHKMINGEEAKVEDYQNHQIHVSEHNKFRKTSDYEKLNPERRNLFEKHVAQHMQYIQSAINQGQGGAPIGENIQGFGQNIAPGQ